MTTTVDLLDAICAHLTQFELPPISSVHAAGSIPAPQVTVQLTGHEQSEIASALLAWADTLTGITAEAWRVPRGDSVHLSVIGRLPGGASIQVYGRLPFAAYGIGGDLAPDASTTVPLAVLRERATRGEVTV